MASLHLLSIDTPSDSSLPLEISIQTHPPLYTVSLFNTIHPTSTSNHFSNSSRLTPPQPHDHHIPLLSNTSSSMLNSIASLTHKKTPSLPSFKQCSMKVLSNQALALSPPWFF